MPKQLVLLTSQLEACKARARNQLFGFLARFHAYLRNRVVSREFPVLFTCLCDAKATGITHMSARSLYIVPD